MSTMFIGLVLMSVGCGEKDADTGADNEVAYEETLLLWNDIQDMESWEQYEGWEGIVPSSSVHGDYVQIWLNEAANNALTTGSDLPDGAIIAKQTFDDANGDTLKDITVMQKIEGFNPEGNGWFWAQYLEDGTVQNEGSPAMCTGCHAGGNDYVLFTSE